MFDRTVKKSTWFGSGGDYCIIFFTKFLVVHSKIKMSMRTLKTRLKQLSTVTQFDERNNCAKIKQLHILQELCGQSSYRL